MYKECLKGIKNKLFQNIPQMTQLKGKEETFYFPSLLPHILRILTTCTISTVIKFHCGLHKPVGNLDI